MKKMLFTIVSAVIIIVAYDSVQQKQVTVVTIIEVPIEKAWKP